MKRYLPLIAVLLACGLVSYVAAIPMPSQVNRAIWIMSLINNKDVDADGQLDILPLADGDAWVEKVYNAYGSSMSPVPVDGDGVAIPYANWTSDQKGKYYCNVLRRWHINLSLGNIRKAASTDAEEAAEEVLAESQLGAEETFD